MMLAALKVYIKTDIKNSVSEDYRDVSRLLVEQGNMSGGFFLYPNFSTHTSAADRVGIGASGDYVVFIFFSIKNIKSDPNSHGASRIIGVFRENPGVASSPIRWFDSSKQNWGQTFSAAAPATLANGETGLEALLPPASFMTSCPVIAKHTLGSAADTAAGGGLSLFYNNGNSCHVTGYILRSKSSSGSASPGYESQTAFNLTVSPRSQ